MRITRCMFPIAWAVVSVENKPTWGWFLKWIQRDLEFGDGSGYTIISDMQKGLESAIQEVMPECEHRMCARHVYAAWAKKWKGEERKKAFWACAKSTNRFDLKANLDVLKELGEGIVEDALIRSNHEIQSWCKAFFNTVSSCDVVDNNLSETFNGWILESRFKSIITMLDDIRVLVMKRISIKSKLPNTWICDISERSLKILEQNIKDSFD